MWKHRIDCWRIIVAIRAATGLFSVQINLMIIHKIVKNVQHLPQFQVTSFACFSQTAVSVRFSVLSQKISKCSDLSWNLGKTGLNNYLAYNF